MGRDSSTTAGPCRHAALLAGWRALPRLSGHSGSKAFEVRLGLLETRLRKQPQKEDKVLQWRPGQEDAEALQT
eukprot:scaffold69462_cov39-Prasinocladus_malaysianus.AAC.2